jgi:hypothetical protein
MTKIKPKCHPYWIINGEKVINPSQVSLALTSQGFVVPCCWADPIFKPSQSNCELYDPELKISNHVSVKSIMLSRQWVSFHNMLQNNPENSPDFCKKYCHE